MAYHADHMTLFRAARRADRRAALFRESLGDKAERWALGLAWALMPRAAAGLPNLARLCFHELLAPDYALPDPERALDNPPGLAGIVHEFTLPTILAAYRRGLYPLAHVAPLKWWSPPQRSVLFFDAMHIAKRLRRQMRQGHYTVTFDRDFDGVITACAGHRQGRWHLTWITPRVMQRLCRGVRRRPRAFLRSVERERRARRRRLRHRRSAASSSPSRNSRTSPTPRRSALPCSTGTSRIGAIAFNDGKVMTPTCHDMGFRDIPRADFLARLAEAERAPGKSGRWQVEADVAAVADWQPQ